MPPLPPVPLTLRVDLKHTMGSDADILSRFYLLYAGTPPTAAQLSTFSAAVGTSWNTNFGPLAHPDTTLVEVETTDISSDTAFQGSALVSHTGTNSGGILPAGVAVMINFRISRRYRGGKPRVYLPYGTDSDVSGPQTWQPSFVTQVNTAWTALIAACVAATWAGGAVTGQVNVSYYKGFTVRPNPIVPGVRSKNIPTLVAGPVVPDPITSISTNGIFASQRRRNRPG